MCGFCVHRPATTFGAVGARCGDPGCRQAEREAAETLATETDRLRADGYPHCAELTTLLADALRTAATWAPPAPDTGSTARFKALMQLMSTWELPLAQIRCQSDQPSRVICAEVAHAHDWAEALAAAGYAAGDVLVEVAR